MNYVSASDKNQRDKIIPLLNDLNTNNEKKNNDGWFKESIDALTNQILDKINQKSKKYILKKVLVDKGFYKENESPKKLDEKTK